MRFLTNRICCAGLSALAMALCLTAPQAARASAVIDTFTTLQIVQGGPAPGPFGPISSTVFGGGILGGSRTITLSGSVFSPQTVAMGAGFGVANYESGAASTGVASLLYNGGGAGLGALLAMTEAIELTVDLFNLGATPTVLAITINDGSTSFTASQTLTTTTATPTTYAFDFTGSGLDFNNISSLLLTIGGGATFGADVSLSSLFARMTPIPEPASIALWGVLGGLGVVCVRRLRRQDR